MFSRYREFYHDHFDDITSPYTLVKSFIPINVLFVLCINHMSRIVRKPEFCLGENKGADQLRGNRFSHDETQLLQGTVSLSLYISINRIS